MNNSKKREFMGKKPTKDFGRPNNAVSTNHEKPLFSFHSLQKGYCISDCQQDEKAKFAETLRKLSQLTWLQLTNAPKYGLGHEKIFTEAIQDSIPQNIPKSDYFLAFRFDGMKPMIGYRENAIFHVLWLDPKFKLYNH
jgi:hypothetical protein